LEKVNTIIEVKHYVECPHCRKSKSRIDHLFDETEKEISWGIWYCDECGGGYKGIIKGRDVFLEKVNERMDKSIVFLRNDNLLLAVKGMYFNGELSAEDERYYYEQHTCPTNYLQNVEMVINLADGDTDPHGIFKYVGAIPYVNLDEVEDIHTLLPFVSKSS
jgi:ribosomal protein L37AE/L43A